MVAWVRWARCLCLLGLILLCAGCAQETWNGAMSRQLARTTPESTHFFRPIFRELGVAYPPKALAFLIFKSTRQLMVYARDHGTWRRIVVLPVRAMSGVAGPKKAEGDYQVPEGIYRIISLNPKSHFDLSMQLNYPNAFDRARALVAGRSSAHLGGAIFIHGGAQSVGCIAIGDRAIERLFPLVAQVGHKAVTVIIAPRDFRVQPKKQGDGHEVLYNQIQGALLAFPT